MEETELRETSPREATREEALLLPDFFSARPRGKWLRMLHTMLLLKMQECRAEPADATPPRRSRTNDQLRALAIAIQMVERCIADAARCAELIAFLEEQIRLRDRETKRGLQNIRPAGVRPNPHVEKHLSLREADADFFAFLIRLLQKEMA